MLDEIGFEDECLYLSLAEDRLDILDLPYHLSFRESELARTIKVGIHTIPEALRLPDVDDFPSLIFHLIYPWTFRQIFEYFFEMFQEIISHESIV